MKLSTFDKERRAIQRAFAEGAMSPQAHTIRLAAVDRREERALKTEADRAAERLSKFYTRAEDAKRQREEAKARAKEREKVRRALHRSISRYQECA